MFEEFTEDYFMDQARALGEEYGVDTRQGSLFMDAATGHCIRIAKFMNDLSTAFEMLAVDTCTGCFDGKGGSGWHLQTKCHSILL